VFDARHGQPATQQCGRTAHDADIAEHDAALGPLLEEQLRDDLRADAARVAHRQREGPDWNCTHRPLSQGLGVIIQFEPAR
jgi:hypothetical protein